MRREINLLPEKYRNINKYSGRKRQRMILWLASILIVISLVYIPLHLISQLKTERANLQNEIASIEDIAYSRITRDNLAREIQKRKGIITSLQGERLDWSEIMMDIANIVPEQMRLELITAIESSHLEITGQAANHLLIAQFVVNLESLDIVIEANPHTIVHNQQGSFVFAITCRIKNGSD